MSFNSNTVYVALYNLLVNNAGLSTLKTHSRKLKHWTEVPPADQPALFVAHGNQDVNPNPRGLPGKVVLGAQLHLYVYEGDPKVTPAIKLLQYVDAIRVALAPSGANQVQTLGGTVSHCWIEGRIETDEGLLGQQSVAIIPVNILVPA